MTHNRFALAASSLLAFALAAPLAGAQTTTTPGTSQTTTTQTTTESAPLTKQQLKDREEAAEGAGESCQRTGKS